MAGRRNGGEAGARPDAARPPSTTLRHLTLVDRRLSRDDLPDDLATLLRSRLTTSCMCRSPARGGATDSSGDPASNGSLLSVVSPATTAATTAATTVPASPHGHSITTDIDEAWRSRPTSPAPRTEPEPEPVLEVGVEADQTDMPPSPAMQRSRSMRLRLGPSMSKGGSSANTLNRNAGSKRWAAAKHALHVTNRLALRNRRMLRQTLISSKPIAACRCFSSAVGIGLVFEDGEVAYLDSHGQLKTSTFVDTGGSVVKAAAFSTNANVLALAMGDGSLAICNARTDDRRDIPVQQPASAKKKAVIRCIVWSTDTSLLITGSEDRSARVFDPETGKELHRFAEPHEDFVVSVAISRDNAVVVTGCKDKHVRGFSRADGLLFDVALDRAYALSFDWKHDRFAVGADDDSISVMETRTGRVLRRIQEHESYVRALVFAQDGRLISTSKDGCMIVYDAFSYEPILKMQELQFVTQVVLSPDNKQIAMLCQDKVSASVNTLTLVNITDQANAMAIEAIDMKGAIVAMACSPSGRYLACSIKKKGVRVVDISVNLAVNSVTAHKKDVQAIAFSPCGQILTSGSADGQVLTYSPTDAKTVKPLHKCKGKITALAYSRCGKWLAIGDSTGTLTLLNHSDKEVARVEAHNGAVLSLAFSSCHCDGRSRMPCETRLVTSGADRALSLFEIYMSEGEGLLMDLILSQDECHDKEIYSVAVSIDGTLIATGSRDKTVKVFEIGNCDELRRIECHSDHVKAVAFTPEGDLVSASLDKTIRVFDEGKTFDSTLFASRCKHMPGAVNCLIAVSATAKYSQLVIAGLDNGQIHFLDMSWCTQQPLIQESLSVVAHDRAAGDYSITRDMVERFPLCVHSVDEQGNTIMHHAVNTEDDTLLEILLQARLPRFWLPVNQTGHDILFDAISCKARLCVRLILDKVIAAKEDGTLAPLPAEHDRFLRNILRMTTEFDDLVAQFLRSLGLFEADPIVGEGCTQVNLDSDLYVAVGSQERAPKHLWRNRRRSGHLKDILTGDAGRSTRLVARYVSIPNMAGILSDDGVQGIARLGNTVLHNFVQAKNAKLFGNSILKSVLHFKWESYAKRLFMRELVCFAANLLSYTLFTICLANVPARTSLKGLFETPWGIFGTVLCLVLPGFSIRELRRERLQLQRTLLLQNRKVNTLAEYTSFIVNYLVDDIWNILQLMCAILTTATAFLFLARSPVTKPCGSIASLLMWMHVLWFLRAFESTGGLVRMVFKVFYYTAPFLLLLTVVMIGCANAFYVLSSDGPRNDTARFQTGDSMFESMYSMYEMLLLGEVDGVDASFPGTWIMVLGRVLTALMMLAVNVFMLNLMINLMDDFMAKIKDEEGDAFPFEKARIIAELELTADLSFMDDARLCPKWLHLLTTKGDYGEDEDQSEWKGTVQAIRDETQAVERRIRAHMAVMESRLKEEHTVAQRKMDEAFLPPFERLLAHSFRLEEQILGLRTEYEAASPLSPSPSLKRSRFQGSSRNVMAHLADEHDHGRRSMGRMSHSHFSRSSLAHDLGPAPKPQKLSVVLEPPMVHLAIEEEAGETDS